MELRQCYFSNKTSNLKKNTDILEWPEYKYQQKINWGSKSIEDSPSVFVTMNMWSTLPASICYTSSAKTTPEKTQRLSMSGSILMFLWVFSRVGEFGNFSLRLWGLHGLWGIVPSFKSRHFCHGLVLLNSWTHRLFCASWWFFGSGFCIAGLFVHLKILIDMCKFLWL